MMWKKLPNEPEKRRDGADFSSLASSIWRKTINSPLTLGDCHQDGSYTTLTCERNEKCHLRWYPVIIKVLLFGACYIVM